MIVNVCLLSWACFIPPRMYIYFYQATVVGLELTEVMLIHIVLEK